MRKEQNRRFVLYARANLPGATRVAHTLMSSTTESTTSNAKRPALDLEPFSSTKRSKTDDMETQAQLKEADVRHILKAPDIRRLASANSSSRSFASLASSSIASPTSSSTRSIPADRSSICAVCASRLRLTLLLLSPRNPT